MVLETLKAQGGAWLPQPGRCYQQLEAQQAKGMGTAEPPAQEAERDEAAGCPPCRAKA